MKLTARAWAVLIEHFFNGTALSAEAMYTVFGDGRDALKTALRELREAGMIELKTYRTDGGQIYRHQSLTVEGHQRLVSRLSLPLSSSYADSDKQIAVIHNANSYYPDSYNSIKIMERSSMKKESEKMGYSFFAKAGSEKQPAATFRDDEWNNTREDKRRKEKISRHGKPYSEWNALNVAWEFFDLLMDSMQFPKNSVNIKTLTGAISTARRKHETNGEIEMQAIKIFLGSVNLKEFQTADQVWKLFISRFPTLVSQIKLSTLTVDEEIRDQELQDRQRARLREWAGNVSTGGLESGTTGVD